MRKAVLVPVKRSESLFGWVEKWVDVESEADFVLLSGAEVVPPEGALAKPVFEIRINEDGTWEKY